MLKELFHYLGTGKALDPFTKARLLKMAENQTTMDRVHTLSAYIHTIDNNRELAKKFALCGLECVEDPATISSCLSVLQLNACSSTAIEQVKQLQNYLDDPNYLTGFSAFFASYPDVIQMERAMARLKNMDLHTTGDLGRLYNYFNKVSASVESAAKELDIEKSMCSRIIEQGAAVLEEVGVVLNETQFVRQPESNWLNIVMYVEAESTRQLAELNWKLMGELFDADLRSPSIVTRFEMVEPEYRIARLRYAD
ncbi:hypothetical protein IG517_14050 [Vibrio cholerae]|uniref:hypothetical protein n=1 Tax=Vibrio cholerae TaxID=666 RepID=UPI0011D88D61|nr:hypothetical protein [Vibrio cholerae]EGQ8324850.1 hypothetical protein [Vibrio cholerae]EGR0612202.1 hypothetical protein [Vibrio cholerae]EJL6314291.1 hypothetical protein [Vibrio cholerae]EJL6470735.1 hypothetical protein [Vibrio cholerae]EKF6711451.1 hypothetical protein [Vibrio cholerae]